LLQAALPSTEYVPVEGFLLPAPASKIPTCGLGMHLSALLGSVALLPHDGVLGGVYRTHGNTTV
jgi:hypothetical protein